jgi:hypothetical protein
MKSKNKTDNVTPTVWQELTGKKATHAESGKEFDSYGSSQKRRTA